MTDVRFEPATRAHAEALAPRMRAADAAECRAALGLGPLEAVLDSMHASACAFAVYLGGELAGICGLALAEEPAELRGQAACAWFLSTDTVERHPRAFLKASRLAVAWMLEQRPVLYNFVDARYPAALRWLERLGFLASPAVAYGPEGLPFHPVVLQRGAPWAQSQR